MELTIRVIDIFGHILSETCVTNMVDGENHINYWLGVGNLEGDVGSIELVELGGKIRPAK